MLMAPKERKRLYFRLVDAPRCQRLSRSEAQWCGPVRVRPPPAGSSCLPRSAQPPRLGVCG